MACAHLVRESLVLTQGGWIPLVRSNLPQEIYGIDRHGRLSERHVACAVVKENSRCAFIATETVYGCFAPETRIVESEGRVLSLTNIVEGNLIADLSMEATMQLPPGLSISSIALDAFWSVLQQSAASQVNDKCILRCRGRRQPESSAYPGTQGITIRKYGKRAFCMISRGELKNLLSKNWVKTITALSEKWLENDEGYLELERFECGVGIWVLSALQHSDTSYRLVCDTRQHTDLVCIDRVSGSTAVIGTGKCAFYTVDPTVQIKIDWEESSWSPVANGFVVAGL